MLSIIPIISDELVSMKTCLTSPSANGAFINVKVFDTYPFHWLALIAGMKGVASPASQVRKHADGYCESFTDQSNKSNYVAVWLQKVKKKRPF